MRSATSLASTALSAASITAMPPFMSATPGPFRTPSSSQRVCWNSWVSPNTVSMWPVNINCTGASGRTVRCRLRPCSTATGLPAESTASTGAASTSFASPGSAEKASARIAAIRSRPARLREPLLTALHCSTWSSIGSAPARSTAACSIVERSPMGGSLAVPLLERHSRFPGNGPPTARVRVAKGVRHGERSK